MAKHSQDYRDLLKDKVLQKKEDNPKYTQSYFASKIGVSKSYLTAVFAHKKHLSADKLDQLCDCLKLDDDDGLTMLILYSKQNQSQKYLTKMLRALQRDHRVTTAGATKKLPSFSKSEKKLVSDEARSALFALMSSIPNGDPQKAHAALRNKSISLGEVKNAIAWLVKNEFLRLENINGVKKYTPLQSYIRSQHPAGPQKYIPWMENAIQVLNEPEPFRPARIQSLTFSFDESNLLELQEEYAAFLKRIQDLSNTTKTDGKVYVIYLQNLFYTLASIDNTSEST
ncbi:TIGR02147 family protein [Bdellovibrio bacteriovorus]|uniref:TIGR02147 family protein n=1 Tax=Bdellovibrio bacteriovorus TaxID=959 RepID=UPI0035A95835